MLCTQKYDYRKAIFAKLPYSQEVRFQNVYIGNKAWFLVKFYAEKPATTNIFLLLELTSSCDSVVPSLSTRFMIFHRKRQQQKGRC